MDEPGLFVIAGSPLKFHPLLSLFNSDNIKTTNEEINTICRVAKRQFLSGIRILKFNLSEAQAHVYG